MVELQNVESQEIEFAEDETSLGSDYPIDKVFIRDESRTVFETLRSISRGQYRMYPHFQRDFVWGESKQSKLIESVLMRIPLPVFYLAEDEDERLIVVDGLQRLSTFREFVDGGSRLRLDNRPELNGKRFEDLTPRLQNRIEGCNLRLYIIDNHVPEDLQLEIFERVNSGERLTRQQIRNALHNGAGTEFLKKEADTDSFKRVWNGYLSTPETVKAMTDRLYVNRFCAFHLLGVEAYQGDMEEFLKDSILRMNKMDERELDALSKEFQNGLDNNFTVFGVSAFGRPTSGQRRVFSTQLWDVMTTELSKRDSRLVKSHSGKLRAEFNSLTQGRLTRERERRAREFQRYFDPTSRQNRDPSDGKNLLYTRDNVMARFRVIRAMLRRVFND